MTAAVRGRPRDPQLSGRVLSTATQVLAARGMAGFTSDEVAASAGVGKASIYRRWTTLHGLLIEVIEDLGVRDVTYAEGTEQMPGLTTTRDDLVRLFTAATSGRRAMAEAAVLSTVGFDPDLRQAYARGPVLRFFQASRIAQQRAADRGEPWPMLDPVQTGWTSLMYRLAVSGDASRELVEDVVDRVVLPALRTVEVAW
jgi:AcrR family transcriptional regulator